MSKTSHTRTTSTPEPPGLLAWFADVPPLLSITAAFEHFDQPELPFPGFNVEEHRVARPPQHHGEDDDHEAEDEQECPSCGDREGHHGAMDCPYGGCEPGEHCPEECPYETAHTDWDRVYPHLPDTMHRGMSMRLSHRPDWDPAAPPHRMARTIASELREYGMGTHWTDDENQGRHYAAVQHRPGHDLHVVLHAAKPDRDDIETDPHELLDQAVIGYEHHDDAEIPLRHGADVHLIGISYRHPDGEDTAWKRHEFKAPLRHTASRRTASGPTWYHGTAGDFDRPTVSEDVEREKVGDHWNLPLGTHWTSNHEVADRIARTAPTKGAFGDTLAERLGGQPRVFHAHLDLANPRVFASEYDMAREAYGHEYDAGNHPSLHDPDHLSFFRGHPALGHENDLRQTPDVPATPRSSGNMGRYDSWLSAHPDRFNIAMRYKQHLIDSGHDGVIYGNEYEGRRPDGRQEDQIPHLHPCAIAFHPDQVHVQAVHHPDAGCGEQHTASGKPWLPHDRYFGPGRPDLDPRLFDGEHLKPAWRKALLALAAKAFAEYGPGWLTWARVYLAGSQASHWYGNNDLDVLIGIDYDAFRRAQPRHRSMSDRQIDDLLNADAHRLCDPARWFTIGGKHLGPFDSTLYVNADSYDIRKIKPYAAYDLTDDTWAVKPMEVPEDFGPDKLPSADFLYARSLASQVRALRKLPAGQAQALGAALYDRLHGERHDAFSGHGGGLYDVRNVAWKYLALHPEHPMEHLVAWKRAEAGAPKTASAMAERACVCCDGAGEHANNHECIYCDASGQQDGGVSGPVPCEGALAETAPVEYRNGFYRSTCPCGMPVTFGLDGGDWWSHADGSISHSEDHDSVAEKMRQIASPGLGAPIPASRHTAGMNGPGSDADFADNSAMIAIVPPRSLADKLVQKDGEPAEKMHVTLAYIPDVGNDRGAVHRAVSSWAAGQQPIRARVQGAGTFVASPHVEHALVDLHRGSDLHSGLMAHLEASGFAPSRKHGFVPHVTLAYRKHHVRFIPKITPEEWTAHHVWVCHGDDWRPVPLGGSTAAAQQN